MRVLIKNGIVVNADGQAKQDLLIESGIVRQLGTDISPQLPCEEIDASGCYVFPGGVDVHTHFNIDVGIARSCDDFFTGTRAAACGGTTTIIDHMGFGPNGCRLRHQLEVYRGYAAHKAVIDYSFHGVIQHINHAILDEIPMMVEEGLSSFKLYLTYQYKLNDDEVLQALRRLHESGALTTVHPENDAAIASKRAEFIAAGLTAPRYHALSRPLECEAEAIARMINLAQIAGNAPLYIVHLSNGLGLDYLRLARANHQPVWVETCPQYLLLDERSYDTEDGMKFILSPPERFVELTSAMPARLFGLWPQKGLLAPGSDGDVVIIDPRQSQQIQHRHLHDNADYSPWEGFTCQGAIVRTLSRGETIFCDGTFTGKAGRGRFLRRKPFVPPVL